MSKSRKRVLKKHQITLNTVIGVAVTLGLAIACAKVSHKPKVEPVQVEVFKADLVDSTRTMVKPAFFNFNLERFLRNQKDYYKHFVNGSSSESARKLISYSMNVVQIKGEKYATLQFSTNEANYDVPPSRKGSFDKKHLLQDPKHIVLNVQVRPYISLPREAKLPWWGNVDLQSMLNYGLYTWGIPAGEFYVQDEEGDDVSIGRYYETYEDFMVSDLCAFSKTYTDHCRMRKSNNGTFHAKMIELFPISLRMTNERISRLETDVEAKHNDLLKQIVVLSNRVSVNEFKIWWTNVRISFLRMVVDQRDVEYRARLTALDTKTEELRKDLTKTQEKLDQVDQEGKMTRTEVELTKVRISENEVKADALDKLVTAEVKRLDGRIDDLKKYVDGRFENMQKTIDAVNTRITKLIEANDEQIKHLKDKDAKLQAALDLALMNLKDLRTDLTKTQGELTAAQVELKTKANATEVIALSARVDKAFDRIRNINRRAEIEAEKLKLLTGRVEKAEGNITELGKDIETLRGEMKTLIATVRGEIATLKAELEGKIKGLDDRIKKLEDARDAQAGELKKTREELVAAVGRLNALEDRMKKAEAGVAAAAKAEDLKALGTEVEKAKGEIKELNDKLAKLTTTVTELKGEMLKLIEEVKGLIKTTKAELIGKINVLKQRIKVLEKSDKTQAAQLKEINDRLIKAEKGLESLEARVKQAEADVATKASDADLKKLKEEVMTAKGEIGTLKTNLATVQGTVTKLVEDLAKLTLKVETEITALKTRLDGEVKRIDDAVKANNALAAELNTVKTSLTALDGQLAPLKQQITYAKAELAKKAQKADLVKLTDKVTEISTSVARIEANIQAEVKRLDEKFNGYRKKK